MIRETAGSCGEPGGRLLHNGRRQWRSRSWLGCIVAIGIFSAACLWFGPGVTDDTFIHLQYAANWADYGELAFNKGEPSYGVTSPLGWPSDGAGRPP